MTASENPVTVTMTKDLKYDLIDVGVKAAQRGDVASLQVLKDLGTDLSPVLVKAIRGGYLDSVRAIRDIGIPITKEHVDWAACRSGDTYFALCDGANLTHPQVALAASITVGKLSFAETLISRYRVAVGEDVINQIRYARRMTPQFIAMLFAALPNAPMSQVIQRRAAQFGSPTIVDRMRQLTQAADRAWLLAVAIKAKNHCVVPELLARPVSFQPSVIARYVEDEAYLGNPQADERNAIDTSFLMTMTQCGAQFELADLQPMVDEFLRRKALRIGRRDYDRTVDLECLHWMAMALSPGARAQLPERMMQSAPTHFVPAMTEADRLQFRRGSAGLDDQGPAGGLRVFESRAMTSPSIQSFVITHPEWGIYLGHCMGLGFWSKLDPNRRSQKSKEVSHCCLHAPQRRVSAAGRARSARTVGWKRWLGPQPQRLAYDLGLLEVPLNVQGVRLSVLPIEETEQTFQFHNFLISDVVPDLKDGKMSPEAILLSLVQSQPPLHAVRSHADVDNVVMTAAVAPATPIQDVNTAALSRNETDVSDRLELRYALDQTHWTLGHDYPFFPWAQRFR